MSAEHRGGELFVYGSDGDYRHGLVDSDVEGFFRLVYDEWDQEEKRWVRKSSDGSMLDADHLEQFARAARLLTAWAKGDQ